LHNETSEAEKVPEAKWTSSVVKLERIKVAH
jgi:hypothetical protein